MPEIPEPLVVGKIGHFMIFYGIPGWSPVRQFNMQIWPPGSQIGDHYMQGGKVANVDWDQSGDLYITSFRGGTWERELFTLLSSDEEAVFVPNGTQPIRRMG
jgi:hypothetical protein